MNKPTGFDSLISKDSRIGKSLFVLSSLLPGAYTAMQTAQHFSHALFRFFVWLIAFLLCFIKWRTPSKSELFDASGQPIVKAARNPTFAWFSIFFFIVLIGDVGFTGVGYFTIAETGPVSHINNSLGLDVKGGEIDYTEYTETRALNPLTAEILYAESALDNYFKFDVQKSDNADSLTIVDIQITVKKFSDIPPELKFGRYTPTMSASPFDVEYMKLIAVELSNKKANALPWTFSAKYILDDPIKQSVKSWGRYSVDLRSKYYARLGVKLFAKDPGLYTYNAQLRVRADMTKTKTIELFETDQILLVLPVKEPTKDLGPPAFAPRPKIQGFPVKRKPQMDV